MCARIQPNACATGNPAWVQALLNMQSAQAAINGGLMTQDIAIGMLADVRARMKTYTKLHIANNQVVYCVSVRCATAVTSDH